MERECKDCKRMLPITSFKQVVDSKTKKANRRRVCDSCHKLKEKARIKKYLEEHPERKSVKYVLSDAQKEARKIKTKERQEKNRDKTRVNSIKRNRENKEKIKKADRERLKAYGRLYAKNNRDKMNKNYNEYFSGSVEGNFLSRCNSRWKKAKKAYELDSSTHKHNIKKESFWQLFNKQDGKCAITNVSLVLVDPNTNEPYLVYEVDHIIPLSKSGVHGIENIQLTYPPANGSKGHKIH